MFAVRLDAMHEMLDYFLTHFVAQGGIILENRTNSLSLTNLKNSKSQLEVPAVFNLLTPNDDYSGRTAPLTSKRCILYIYSTNIGTEYFKHGIYSPFLSLQNAVCFINLTYLVPVLFTFYIQDVLKLKK